MAYKSEFSNRKEFLDMVIPTDEKGLTDLIAKQKPKIMKHLYFKFENKLNEDDREDIFQNASIAVWKAFKHKEDYLAHYPSTFENYFRGICNNQALNTIRNREMTVPNSTHIDENGKKVADRISKTMPISTLITEDSDGSVNLDKVSQLLEIVTSSCAGDIDLADIEAVVHEIIKSLPDYCNRIFHGMYWDDMDQKAIAEKYGFNNAATVKSTKTRCVKKFKEKMESLFPDVFKLFKK